MSRFEEKSYDKVNFKTWRKIFRIILRRKKLLVGFILCIVALSALDSLVPLLNKYVIDNYFDGTGTYPHLEIVISLYFFIAVAYFLVIRGFFKYTTKLETFVSYELRREAFANLQRLPYSYYDRTPQGWLMARMTSDSRKLANILSWGIMSFGWGILTMLFILVIMIIIDAKLALIMICLLPILLAFSILVNKKILKSYRKARKINSQITALYSESLMGSKTSKSLVIEDENYEEFKDQVHYYRRSFLRATIVSATLVPVIFILMTIGVGSTLYFGAKVAIAVGTLYAFTDYTTRFFDPVMQMAQVLANFQNAQAAAERVVSLIETEPEIMDSPAVVEKYGDFLHPKKENWEELKGDIEFKDVTFKYNEGETVLSNFNLKVKAGSSVAIVGKTGGGKSTIVNLLCRFYEPTEGEILIDGRNYKERSVGWLHSNLGYVLQTPQLFSGTIMENIRYGRLEATDEEVITAAKYVNAHDFIINMDDGYETILNEGGSNLSLGQKQLISFARAIVANPRILVLDEATSSIDTLTEEVIKEAINRVMENRTSFAIAHRLSTIVNSDLILVIDDGKIVESGTHKELLHKYGYYYELYKNQFIREMDEKTKSL